MGWPTVKLCEVAQIERNGIASEAIEAGTKYLGLEHIESGGRINGFADVDAGELASAKFQFTSSHVLYGKLRPYLAKIALPDFDGICSTDIVPIKPKRNLDRRYLAYFLRQPDIVAYANSRATGANLPRLSPKALADFEIPLAPLEEQKRIAAILDQADDIRRKRQHAIDRLNQLGQAIFHEMFGQMRKAPFQWPSVAFGEIVESAKIGLVRSSQEMGDQFEVPYLRMDAIQRNGQLELGGMKKTHATKNERDEFSLSAGDFLFNTRNSKELVGKSGVAINDIDAVYNNNILRVKFKDVANSIYVHAYFREPYAQQELEIRKSGTTSVFAIYQKNLETMPVPLPPIDMQINFASRVQYIFELSQKFIAAQSFSSGFFASLQHRAFTGQL